MDRCPSLRLAVFESRSEVKGFAPAARRASGSTAQTPSCSDTDFSETGKGSDATPADAGRIGVGRGQTGFGL